MSYCIALGRPTLSRLWLNISPNVSCCNAVGRLTLSRLWLKSHPNVSCCNALGRVTLSRLRCSHARTFPEGRHHRQQSLDSSSHTDIRCQRPRSFIFNHTWNYRQLNKSPAAESKVDRFENIFIETSCTITLEWHSPISRNASANL